MSTESSGAETGVRGGPDAGPAGPPSDRARLASLVEPASATPTSTGTAPAARAPAGSDPGTPTAGPARATGRAPAVPAATAPAPRRPAQDPRARSATPAAGPSTGARPVATPAGPRIVGPVLARRVHRLVRHIDPWSVLKVSIIFFFCAWLMVLISGLLLWGVAVGSGTVGNIERFIAQLLALEEFRFDADQIFRIFALGGLISVFAVTALTVVLTVLFNLISDLVGGIRLTVIEEESARRVIREGRPVERPEVARSRRPRLR